MKEDCQTRRIWTVTKKLSIVADTTYTLLSSHSEANLAFIKENLEQTS